MTGFRLNRVGGPDDPVLDVIFVHGLGSSSTETWTNDAGDFWPGWLVDLAPGVAVWSLEYPAAKTKWGKKGSGLDLKEVARTACGYVADSGGFERPTVWVAHSLGGLVVKQILRVGELGDNHLAEAKHQTVAVAFVATPHRGSDLATVAKRLRVVRPSGITLDLEPGDTSGQELHDWFRTHAAASGLSILAFAETRPVGLPGGIGGVTVVETWSPNPEILGALVRHLTEDHFSIAKPMDDKDPVVVGVVDQIRRALEAERVRERAQSTELGEPYRLWPLPRVAEADPFLLGVFRADGFPADAPYIPRDRDQEIDESLRAGGVTLLRGPSKSGKSRTALEAARRVLPDARVIAPRSPSSARDALSKVSLDRMDTPAMLVWLDDFERFLGPTGLDARQLEDLARRLGVTVLGTIRSIEYDRARTTEGEIGRSAREALEVATMILLEAELSPGERTSAARRYPDERFTDDEGIGEHFASGRQLRERLEAGVEACPAGIAVVYAAVDWLRCGMTRGPSKAELRVVADADLRRRLPLNSDFGTAFDDGLSWAHTPVERGAALLGRRDVPDGELMAPDYVVELRETSSQDISDAVWATLLELLPGRELFQVGVAAYNRQARHRAVEAFERVIDSGHPDRARRRWSISGSCTRRRVGPMTRSGPIPGRSTPATPRRPNGRGSDCQSCDWNSPPLCGLSGGSGGVP